MPSEAESTGRDRRMEPRFDVELEVTLRAYRVAPIVARMLDLSTTGSLLKCERHGFHPGDEVLLSAEKIEAVATVAWIRDAFLGLAFHRRLDSHHIAMLRRAGRR